MGSKYRDTFYEAYTAPATAVAFSRVCGFIPKHVKVQNVSSLSSIEWFNGMAAASGLLMTAATGVVTLPTSNGITVGTVTDSVTGKVGKGFTVGLHATVNIATEVLAVYAE